MHRKLTNESSKSSNQYDLDFTNYKKRQNLRHFFRPALSPKCPPNHQRKFSIILIRSLRRFCRKNERLSVYFAIIRHLKERDQFQKAVETSLSKNSGSIKEEEPD